MKGTKRKAEEKEEESEASSSNNKRAPKARRAEAKDLEEKHKLEDLWKAAFPVGTEWDQLDSVYQYKWKFSTLEDAFKQGGKLHGKRQNQTRFIIHLIGDDELDEITDELIEADALDEDQTDAFKEFVKDAVREAKKNKRKKREDREKAIEEMSEERKQAYQNMRLYKFYPVSTPDTPDVSNVKASFINRYYGKAHEVL
ncbi:hypothetical protein COLO4_23020 [Corchorus olitorius]|uniref:Uncharacterized protein n=1 Tax=Corchorus olitorius TaxID=93759 RepID=A0A1R3IIQ4_9ROSI|nr:hypothetical protein COLO4_23020 [Corchorus olitorius]